MVKLKKYRVHKAICDICNGNGFVKIKPSNYMLKLLGKKPNSVENVHQCWECDSEGEYYVYNPTSDSSDNNSTDHYNSNPFLH
jgi:hypothetical protein